MHHERLKIIISQSPEISFSNSENSRAHQCNTIQYNKRALEPSHT